MDSNILDKVVSVLASSNNTVVVTGAGISTEAGIPDFRGEKGIYKTLGEDRVMNIININFFKKNPESFYEFYFKYFTLPQVEPSLAHKIMALMEDEGRISAVVTQNVDGLHEKAGSHNVIAVHGTRTRFICTNKDCKRYYSRDNVLKMKKKVPECIECGGVLKPDVVLFGEPIQQFNNAREQIMNADVLMVIGSSLVVYPLAGFVQEFAAISKNLIIINKGPTQMDYAALVKVEVGDSNTGEILQKIKRRLI
ncbi:MAG: NAD-dependent protein deacylase [Syntrophomonadaceae bacterium]|jgi:NAD-dependent deacetylase